MPPCLPDLSSSHQIITRTTLYSGMVGAGGNRTWVIVAKDTGDQKFSAIYRRSWENVTGNETTYSVTIKVVKA